MTVVWFFLGIIALIVFGPLLLRLIVGVVGLVFIIVFSILHGAYKIFKWANDPENNELKF